MSEEDEVRHAYYRPLPSFRSVLTPVFLCPCHLIIERFQPFRLVESLSSQSRACVRFFAKGVSVFALLMYYHPYGPCQFP
jgi:hypothetical protein